MNLEGLKLVKNRYFLPRFLLIWKYLEKRVEIHFYIYFIVSTMSAAAAAKSLQSCLTLCNPIDGSPPGSTIPGILQARTLEWVAISFSNAWKWKVKVKLFSHVWLSATSWTAAYQAPPSMGFSRQEYWSEVPLPSPTMVLGDSKKNWAPSHMTIFLLLSIHLSIHLEHSLLLI